MTGLTASSPHDLRGARTRLASPFSSCCAGTDVCCTSAASTCSTRPLYSTSSRICPVLLQGPFVAAGSRKPNGVLRRKPELVQAQPVCERESDLVMTSCGDLVHTLTRLS